MHILKRGKVPSGEGAYFNIQNDDVTVSKIVDQIILFSKNKNLDILSLCCENLKTINT